MCWEIPWVNFQQKKWCSKRDINNKVGKESSRNDKHRNVFFWWFNGYLCPDLFYPNPICHNIPGFLTIMTMLCCLNFTFWQGSSTFASHRLKPLSSPVATLEVERLIKIRDGFQAWQIAEGEGWRRFTVMQFNMILMKHPLFVDGWEILHLNRDGAKNLNR